VSAVELSLTDRMTKLVADDSHTAHICDISSDRPPERDVFQET
jgi:hypothetical protein